MNRTNKDIYDCFGDAIITRGEAIRIINQVISKYRIMDNDRSALLEIIFCLEAEKNGWFHFWGGDQGEAALLSLSPQSCIIMDFDKDELFDIYKRYRFSPSLTDKKEKKMSEEGTKYVLENKLGELVNEG